MVGLRAAKELSRQFCQGQIFWKNVRVGRYEIFFFLFWKAIKLQGRHRKKKKGLVGVSRNARRPFFFLGLRTIFTRASSFVLVLLQSYEKY